MAESAVIIVPNPQPVFTERDVSALRKYVRRGGIVWLIDSNRGQSEMATRVLAAALHEGAVDGPSRESPSELHVELSEPPGVTTSRACGDGSVIVSTGGDAFSRWGLGHPFPEPKGAFATRIGVADAVLTRLAAHAGLDARRRFGPVADGQESR